MFDLGKIIREQRLLRRMTQEQVARALEVTAATVVRWENNYKKPSSEHLIALAVLFNISVNELIGRQKERVIVIDALTKSQQKLLQDIATELAAPEKHRALSRIQKDILCRLLDEFLKGE